MVNYYDAVVVGAGFSGLYMLHKLREAGYRVKVYEAGSDVGGTWYWSRYPGARCDSESIYYNYTFSEEIYNEWTWSERFASQSEILEYLNFVADRLDLRKDIQFDTRVISSHYQDKDEQWLVTTDDGEQVKAKYFITGVGCLSTANIPKFKGLEKFKGEWYHTGRWPHEGVDFKGKTVGVIGTGSSGIQSIPVIAEEAEKLYVFQRTPQYSIPARNHPYSKEFIQQTKANFHEIRKKMHQTSTGLATEPRNRSALSDPPEKRKQAFEKAWEEGGLNLFYTYNDFTVNEKANATISAFIREKIAAIVKDPEVRDKLMPTYYFGTKRPVLDTNYFETFNKEHVELVNVKEDPIQEITEKGVGTKSGAEYPLDILVFATGYDAMTGTLLKMDIRGRDGLSLREKWADGAETKTYLGLAVNGFPNMFMITGPESPSVLSNVPTSIEQHVEWIFECIEYMKEKGYEIVEATEEEETSWSTHCREVAESTLFVKTDSWYTGANIEGKPRRFPIYLGGVGTYGEKIKEVANKNYEGFKLQVVHM